MLFANAMGAGDLLMTHSLAEAILRHEWLSNVREVVATAREVNATFSRESPLDLSVFGNRLAPAIPPVKARPSESPSAPNNDAPALSAEELVTMLAAAGGTVSKVARAVGRSRRQVYRWIQKYGIRLEDFRS
jgi:DNA-binding NtrC family response regulator